MSFVSLQNSFVHFQQVIKWEYFIKLHEIRSKDGLVAADKLWKAHIQYPQQKMKVKLAMQILSNSVTGAL